MKKIKRAMFIEEKGLTLVEVLASIVILSIVLIIFLSIFIQTAKTNQTSEGIIDATYIAQTEMEVFYAHSLDIEKSALPTKLTNYSYETDATKDIYTTNRESFTVVITLSDENELTNILVQVFDSLEQTKPVAQMQNLVGWRADDEE